MIDALIYSSASSISQIYLLVHRMKTILIIVFIRWTAQEIWDMEEAELEKQRIYHMTPKILEKVEKNNVYLQRHTTPRIECCQIITCSWRHVL